MWQPDGWGWRVRIAVLTPHGDIEPEAEFRAMAPEGVSIHPARVPLGAFAPGGRGTMDRITAHDAVRAFAEPALALRMAPSRRPGAGTTSPSGCFGVRAIIRQLKGDP